MSYHTHKSCKTPKDKNNKVWRYLDFTKFISLLEERALFFSALSQFTDPMEGFLTNPTVQKLRSVDDKLPDEVIQRIGRTSDHNLNVLRNGRKLMFVSSWHMNEHESAAMWDLYLKRNEGVAIQSTIGKMIDSFTETKKDICIGEIEYVDFEKDEFNSGNLFYLAMHKRKSFEHEKEVRAIFLDPDYSAGKLVPVDLDTLIDNIYIAPNSPLWIYELIQKILVRYGIKKVPIHSGLDQTPLY